MTSTNQSVNSSYEESVFCSEKIKKQFEVTWDIKDLRVCIQEDEPVISPRFGSDDCQWYLRIMEFQPNYETLDNYCPSIFDYRPPQLHFYICREEKLKIETLKSIKYNLLVKRKTDNGWATFINESHRKLLKGMSTAELKWNDMYHFKFEQPKPFSPTDIRLDSKIVSNADDELKIKFSLTAYYGIKPVLPPKKFNIENSSVKFKDSALKNYENLFDNEEFSDVKIICECQTINCHKSILALKSPVFRAMIKSDMKEKSENIICIDDISYEILKKALRFIYSPNVESILEDAKELIPVAEQYEIDDLKRCCEEYLISKINKGNVQEILNIAILYRCKLLKEEALNLISQEIIYLSADKIVDNLPDPEQCIIGKDY